MFTISFKIWYLVYVIKQIYEVNDKEFERSVRCDCNQIQPKIGSIVVSIYVLNRAYYLMIFYIKRSTSIFNKLLLLIQINISGVTLYLCVFYFDSLQDENEMVAIL